MASLGLSVLPKNWREKAVVVNSKSRANEFRELGTGVYVDDNCPAQLLVVIIDEDGCVFRLEDPAITLLVLRQLGIIPALTGLYLTQHIPPIEEFKSSAPSAN